MIVKFLDHFDGFLYPEYYSSSLLCVCWSISLFQCDVSIVCLIFCMVVFVYIGSCDYNVCIYISYAKMIPTMGGFACGRDAH